MARKPERLSDQIRQAIDASDLSRYRICKTLNIDEASMSRFMTGRGGLHLATIDAIAELLGLSIQQADKAKQKRSK